MKLNFYFVLIIDFLFDSIYKVPMEFCLLLQMVKFLEYVLCERFWIFFFYFLPRSNRLLNKNNNNVKLSPQTRSSNPSLKSSKVWIHFKAYSKTQRCQNQSRFPNFLIEEWVLCPFRQFPLIMGWKPFLSLFLFLSFSPSVFPFLLLSCNCTYGLKFYRLSVQFQFQFAFC